MCVGFFMIISVFFIKTPTKNIIIHPNRRGRTLKEMTAVPACIYTYIPQLCCILSERVVVVEGALYIQSVYNGPDQENNTKSRPDDDSRPNILNQVHLSLSLRVSCCCAILRDYVAGRPGG